jgi:hypothetical protein
VQAANGSSRWKLISLTDIQSLGTSISRAQDIIDGREEIFKRLLRTFHSTITAGLHCGRINVDPHLSVAHNWNSSQWAVLQLAVNIFGILRAALLKIQVLWGVTGILGLINSEDEANKFLRNVRLKCRDTTLRLQVADSCLKCLVDDFMSVALLNRHRHWYWRCVCLVVCLFG